ncbi:MAG: hypothetical protein AAFX85_04225, partial [Pseudomonadota bacterium]
MASPIARAKHGVRRALRRSPAIYLWMIRNSRRPFDNSLRRIGPQTALVIDAFPRSANTFATFAFLSAQLDAVEVAHHFHAPAAIAAAAKYRVPALTIIREPVAAIASVMTYRGSAHVWQGIAEYTDYYRAVSRHLPHVFVASFEAVISDFGHVSALLNERFDTRFGVFEHTADNVVAVQNEVRRVQDYVLDERPQDRSRYADLLPVPAPEREAKKRELIAAIEHPRHAKSLREARRL